MLNSQLCPHFPQFTAPYPIAPESNPNFMLSALIVSESSQMNGKQLHLQEFRAEVQKSAKHTLTRSLSLLHWPTWCSRWIVYAGHIRPSSVFRTSKTSNHPHYSSPTPKTLKPYTPQQKKTSSSARRKQHKPVAWGSLHP